jgi:SAM-dependent methyltransferase
MSQQGQDDRLFATAVQRNREPILKVLEQVLPAAGTVLEIASGTGEHGAYFAPRFSNLTWQPSDANTDMHKSILAWAKTEAPLMKPPLALDAAADTWPIEQAAAIVCINMIHISPWRSCLGLMAGAGRILEAGGILYLYGPYKINGEHYAESNAAFDQSLRSRDPEWGVRNLDDVIEVAQKEGLQFQQYIEMPANNLSVIFAKAN